MNHRMQFGILYLFLFFCLILCGIGFVVDYRKSVKEPIHYINCGHAIVQCNKIKYVYKKFSINEDMTPVYSVYADIGVGQDVLLYQCNTEDELKKFIDTLYENMNR